MAILAASSSDSKAIAADSLCFKYHVYASNTSRRASE